jgi:hypothetical protein
MNDDNTDWSANIWYIDNPEQFEEIMNEIMKSITNNNKIGNGVNFMEDKKDLNKPQSKPLNSKTTKRLKSKLDKLTPPKEITIDPSTNPYEQARKAVLSKKEGWKQRELLEMERTGDTDNRWYDDFVKEIIALAEKNT